jgi:hypothetical protein
MTVPIAVTTSISPLDKPKASGNKIIRLRPNSSTVAVKSVPRIAILAVGVFRLIFCLSMRFKFPVINLAVPNPKLKPSLILMGLGHIYIHQLIIENVL